MTLPCSITSPASYTQSSSACNQESAISAHVVIPDCNIPSDQFFRNQRTCGDPWLRPILQKEFYTNCGPELNVSSRQDISKQQSDHDPWLRHIIPPEFQRTFQMSQYLAETHRLSQGSANSRLKSSYLCETHMNVNGRFVAC